MIGLRPRETAPAPTGGGRRREALLRQQADQANAQRLTAADVETLERDRSAESRAAIAAKFGRQFDELAVSSQRSLAHLVLDLLVRDVASEVRQSLAYTIAGSPNLPVPTALKLAQDELEVARPILERSPVLSDEALIQVIRTNAMQYALAVAGRERLSETVGAALVETRHQEVVVRLLGNAGAALSQRTLDRVLEEHQASPEVEARLVRRPELPHEIIEQLVGLIGDRLEWELVRTRRMPAEQARMLMNAVRERAAIGFTAREHSDRRIAQNLRERFAAGQLTHDDLLRCLKEGDVAGLEIGLALHARLEPVQVRKLFYHHDRRHMAALCISAGFATPHYIALRMTLDLAEAAVSSSGKTPTYGTETVRYLQVQYERLRGDEAKLRELLNA